jgi:lipid A oxidase
MNQIKLGQGTVLMAAAFTGSSRIESNKHTIWQVLAGSILGWFVQAAALTWFDRGLRRMLRGIGSLFSRLKGLVTGAGAVALALMVAAPQDAVAEVDIAVYTGWQTSPHSTVTGNDPASFGAFDFTAGWEGRSFAAPPHYGIRATWWRNELWGLDADFNHTKVYADDETLGASGTSGGFEVLEFTDGLNTLTFGVVRRWPDQWGRVTPYAGAGIGVAIPHVEVQSAAGVTETIGYQIGGPAASWRVGGTVKLSDSWGMFAEYKGTYSMLDVDLDGGGNLQTDIITNALNIGIQYTFD